MANQKGNHFDLINLVMIIKKFDCHMILVAKQLVTKNFWLPYVWRPNFGETQFQLPYVRDQKFLITNSLGIETFFQSLVIAIFYHNQLNFWLLSVAMCKTQWKLFKNVLTYNMPIFQIQSLAIEKFHLPSNTLDVSNGNRNTILITICQMTKMFWLPTIWQPEPFLGH
jgi:hypothetical protein